MLITMHDGSHVVVKQPTDIAKACSPHDQVTVTQSGSGGIPYSGPYDVVPNMETQTLSTVGMTMRDNVTVYPIPSEYTDYEMLSNKPQIDGVTLVGNKTARELGVRPIGNASILDLFR